MKCKDCKFAERQSSGRDSAMCKITLPAWLQQREGESGRHIYIGEWSSDECDLGIAKEESKYSRPQSF
jgi:hypothetical protein